MNTAEQTKQHFKEKQLAKYENQAENAYSKANIQNIEKTMKKRKASNIKVNKDIALALSIYCKLNNVRMVDFANEVMGSKLKDFEEKLKVMRSLD